MRLSIDLLTVYYTRGLSILAHVHIAFLRLVRPIDVLDGNTGAQWNRMH
jgi:hypothetical protein